MDADIYPEFDNMPWGEPYPSAPGMIDAAVTGIEIGDHRAVCQWNSRMANLLADASLEDYARHREDWWDELMQVIDTPEAIPGATGKCGDCYDDKPHPDCAKPRS